MHTEFIKVPEEIKSRSVSAPLEIPFTFIQTYKDNYLHPKVYENTMGILRANSEFDYRLITDRAAEKLITDNFGEKELSAFKRLKNGSARGDFARYAAMYVYGGVYMDLDCKFDGRFADNMDFGKEYLFMIDHGTCLLQCFFATKPGNPLIKNVIDACCDQIEKRVPRIGDATGPSIFTYVIYCSVLGPNPDYKTLPITDGVLQIQNPIFSKGAIFKLYTLNQIDGKHYRKFWYKFRTYADSMLYPSPDQKYNLKGKTLGLYHED